MDLLSHTKSSPITEDTKCALYNQDIFDLLLLLVSVHDFVYNTLSELACARIVASIQSCSKSKIVLAVLFVSDCSSSKPAFEPCKESLYNKSCLIVIVLKILRDDEFGIIPVGNAAANSMTSEIISDVCSIITLVCMR